MTSNSKPATVRLQVAPLSKLGRLARGKAVILVTLLASTALIGEPQVAQARGGMNGFMAGAILGGALGGLAGRQGRVYRGGRVSSRHATTRHRGRSKEKEPEVETVVHGTPAGNSTGGDAFPASSSGSATPASAPAASSTASAAAAASDGAASSARASSRRGGGQRGLGSVESFKDGLD